MLECDWCVGGLVIEHIRGLVRVYVTVCVIVGKALRMTVQCMHQCMMEGV